MGRKVGFISCCFLKCYYASISFICVHGELWFDLVCQGGVLFEVKTSPSPTIDEGSSVNHCLTKFPSRVMLKWRMFHYEEKLYNHTIITSLMWKKIDSWPEVEEFLLWDKVVDFAFFNYLQECEEFWSHLHLLKLPICHSYLIVEEKVSHLDLSCFRVLVY